jgi:hypothetical protein
MVFTSLSPGAFRVPQSFNRPISSTPRTAPAFQNNFQTQSQWGNSTGFFPQVMLTLMLQLFQSLLSMIGQGFNGWQQPQPPLNPDFVDGSTGPVSQQEPGGFGRNAFINRQELINAGLFDPNRTTVRYTPENDKRFEDLFGYSEESIAMRDVNGDGALSFQEYARNMGAGEDPETSFFILDANQDGFIDPVELSALGLLTDANGDGQITPEERAQLSALAQASPEFTRMALGQIIAGLELRQRYQEFQIDSSANPFVPGL